MRMVLALMAILAATSALAQSKEPILLPDAKRKADDNH